MSATTLRSTASPRSTSVVRIAADGASLTGELTIPAGAIGVAVFAQTNAGGFAGRGSRRVAASFQARGYATLLFDLLTPDEEIVDAATWGLRGDLSLLARRLIDSIDWLHTQPATAALKIGLIGEGAGAAAAFVAACVRPDIVAAVVSHADRPDLASPVLGRVCAPALLIVRGDDDAAIRSNDMAFRRLNRRKEMVRLGSEGGEETIDELSRLALAWFTQHVAGAYPAREPADEMC